MHAHVANSTDAARRFVTLSFSGAGHLLPYHLGVASALLQDHRSFPSDQRGSFPGSGTTMSTGTVAVASDGEKTAAASGGLVGAKPLPSVAAVSGSSSGAVAAVLFARLPDRIDEYADRFIAERGGALRILRDMLHEAERRESFSPLHSRSFSSSTEVVVDVVRRRERRFAPSLHVAATRCSDGRLHLASFPRDNGAFRTVSSVWNTDRVLRWVEASCRIPRSFHPVDVTTDLFGRPRSISYPDEEGVCIDGEYYVDGGIAAPSPPTPRDDEAGAVRIIVSPISGTVPFTWLHENHDDAREMVPRVERISPCDQSWNLLPFELGCNGGFRVRPSVQNLRAMRMSMGAATGEELRHWYEQGQSDGKQAVARLTL